MKERKVPPVPPCSEAGFQAQGRRKRIRLRAGPTALDRRIACKQVADYRN
jgi:hypothetical protein